MVNVVSGFLGKWIYAPTPDKKYILELGYSYKDLGEVVKDSDPLLITEQLTEISPLVKNIRLFGVFGNEFKDKIDENYKPTVETLDEIGKLAKSFNKMTIEIKNSYNKLEEITREKTKAKRGRRELLRYNSRKWQRMVFNWRCK